MNKKREVYKRLSMNLPVGVHEKLKEIAEKRNISLTCVVTRAIFDYLHKEMETE